MTVFWRTFVYNADVDNDRLKRPLLEFGPIDDEVQPDGSKGRFADNVFLQTKNGPLDFQSREPLHPMFGRMENTNQAMELQITQEYTGQSRMLTYLGPMWEEVLKTDTGGGRARRRGGRRHRAGPGRHRARRRRQPRQRTRTSPATTSARPTCSPSGRLAWDWKLGSEDIARDWVRMTWSNDAPVVDTIVRMMMGSWEANVSYETPLGVAHQFRSSDHYGPMPNEWFQRDDWSPVYYNKADSAGLGFNRSPTGSNLVGQYFSPLKERYSSIDTTPENLLMWFHHVPWDRTMSSGRPFWDELVYRYQMGVQYVTWLRETWETLQPVVGARRWAEVRAKLVQHETDAASLARHQRQLLARVQRPAQPRRRWAAVARRSPSGGKERRGFDLSASSYTVPVAARSPAIAARSTRPRGRSSCRQTRHAGRREGDQDRLLRAAGEELRVQHRAGHVAGVVAREPAAVDAASPA